MNKIFKVFCGCLLGCAISTVLTSCSDDDDPTLLSVLKVSSSYVSIDQNGGSNTITVNAQAEWAFVSQQWIQGKDTIKAAAPQWLTVSTTSGAAGQTEVSFAAESTLDGRTCELLISCEGQTQRINVIQGIAAVESATCADIIAGPDSKTYQVTGTCVRIANTSYGNWYLEDATGQIYIYGTVDASGNADGKIALVNYADGSVYIVDIGASDVSGLSLFESDSSTIHAHRYFDGYPTCTLQQKCVDCGFIKQEALGHTYENVTPTPTVGDEENSHYTKRCKRCGMPGGYENHTAVYTYLGSWSHRTKCTVCGYESPSVVACTVVYSKPDDYTRRPDYHVKTCSVCAHSEEEAHTFAYRRISYAEHEKYCSVCDYVVLSEHHIDDNDDDKCDLCSSELVAYPLFRIVTMVNSSATDESGRHVAKYGDTIELTLSTDKEIKNLVVYIAGQRVPNGNMVTSDNRNWKLTLTLTSSMNIPDGELSLKVNCESMTGVAIPVPITTVTDERYVSFEKSITPEGKSMDLLGLVFVTPMHREPDCAVPVSVCPGCSDVPDEIGRAHV